MAPAGRPGAHAKVVLLTVALAKDLFVERTDRVQQLPTDVHAEADCRRHVDAGTGVDGGTQSVQLRIIKLQRHIVVLTDRRVAADGGIGGQRRDRSHAFDRSPRPEAVEPVPVDQRVAVQQHDVPVGVETHPPVRGADKASVLLVDEQGNRAGFGKPAQTTESSGSGLRSSITTISKGASFSARSTECRQARVSSRPR